MMENNTVRAGREIEFLNKQSVNFLDGVPLFRYHAVFAHIKVAQVFNAKAVRVCALDAGGRNVKRAAGGHGSVRKDRQVLRNLAETALDVCLFHGPEPVKMIVAVEIPIRRNKSVVVLNEIDGAAH